MGGDGAEDGPGEHEEAEVRRAEEKEGLVEPEWVQGLVVRGITLTNSPYWTLHPIYCTDVTISDIVITAGYGNMSSSAGSPSSTV